MRFHSPLDDLLGTPIRVKLLRIMSRRSGTGFTGRELARLCRASPSQTNAGLAVLEASGLVQREIAGRSHVWRLSEKHVLVKTILRLFRDETDAYSELKSEIENRIRRLPVLSATLYGSVARGDERPTSDVDLLVRVRNRTDRERVEDELSAGSFSFIVKFGNALSPLVVEPSEERHPTNPELLRHVREEGVELSTGK
jgi:predicted nucleotidyltransferase